MSKKTRRSFVFHSIAAVALGAAAMLPMAAMATVTVYVGGDGASDDNVGTSPTAPFATIEKAMDKVNAENNADNCKVYVRAGTYNVSMVKSFNKGNYISLIGETGSPGDVVIDGGGNTSIFNSQVNAWKNGLTLLNVTIQNATGTAVYFQSHYSVVSNCVFRGNAARAFQTGQNATIIDCVFEDNGDGSVEGGAVRATEGTIIRGCSFSRNKGLIGGAVAGIKATSSMNDGYQIALDGCAFTNNFSATVGGAFCGLGGNGIVNCDFIGNVASNEYSTATGNDPSTGAVVARGGAMALIGNTLPANAHVISNCTFSANVIWGDGGSAVFVRNGDSVVVDCNFVCNTSRTSVVASPAGGAFYRNFVTGTNHACTENIERCIFDGNVADGPGASNGYSCTFRNCLFINNENKANEGGAIRASTKGFCAENCTFAVNSATTYGGAVALAAAGAHDSAFTNCLFVLNEARNPGTSHAKSGVNVGWYNTDANWYPPQVKSFYNCMEVVSQEDYDKGGSGITTGGGKPAVLWYGTGATDFANKVVAGTLADFFIDAANGDYTTVKKSPARNVGVNHDWMASATDLIGKVRINADDGSIVDIGCYEWYNLNPPGLMIFVR